MCRSNVQNYVDLFNAMTGKKIDKAELIHSRRGSTTFSASSSFASEGTRKDHNIPLRAISPVFQRRMGSQARLLR